ncbi:MAG: restriction endonuclease subunit S, partial [Alistipes sp.]|nr:restriction endonuclease subunit S [Alistipes sp.]
MKLEANKWKSFEFGLLIDEIYKAKANAKVDLTTSVSKVSGYIPFVSRTESNNSVDCFVLEDEIHDIEAGNAITVGDTTATVAYQQEPFATGDHIVVIRSGWLNQYTGLFIVALLRRERFRYSYGRAYLIDSIKTTRLMLPVTKDSKPDWKWMEAYIKSLHYKPVLTCIKKENTLQLDTGSWKEFYLHRIMNVEMGNGIDAILTTSDNPKYNYVSRHDNDNGVAAYVDEIEGEVPFPAGAMSLALGGSLGACFIQTLPFYTAQNV